MYQWGCQRHVHLCTILLAGLGTPGLAKTQLFDYFDPLFLTHTLSFNSLGKAENVSTAIVANHAI